MGHSAQWPQELLFPSAHFQVQNATHGCFYIEKEWRRDKSAWGLCSTCLIVTGASQQFLKNFQGF